MMEKSGPQSVFVSYALADRPHVKKFFDKLRSIGIVSQNEEIIDHTNIIMKGSLSARNDVRKAIEDASKVIVLWSGGGAESEWVNYETAMADALGKEIIVVVSKGQRSRIPEQIAENTILEMDNVH